MIYISDDTYNQSEFIELVYSYKEKQNGVTQHINMYNPDIEIEQ